jgi:hypothetical protein
LGQDGPGLLATEHGLQALGRLGPHDPIIESVQRPVQDDLVKEEPGTEGPLLGRGGDVPLHRQVGEERDDFRLAHLQRMPLAVDQEEWLDPEDISVLGADAIVPLPGRVTAPIEPSEPVGNRPQKNPSKSADSLQEARNPGMMCESVGIMRNFGRTTIRLFTGSILVRLGDAYADPDGNEGRWILGWVVAGSPFAGV